MILYFVVSFPTETIAVLHRLAFYILYYDLCVRAITMTLTNALHLDFSERARDAAAELGTFLFIKKWI